MAFRKPVIALNIVRITDRVNKCECGILFDSCNIKNLFEKMGFLYFNEF